jgi:signal transduction histidine kinase
MSITSKKYVKFHLRLFWSVLMTFFLISSCFMVFQYTREKQYKIDILNTRISGYNDYIYLQMQRGIPVEEGVLKNLLRVSIIDFTGGLIYDSVLKEEYQKKKDFLDCKEVQEAMDKGIGYTIRTSSAAKGEKMFFSAKKYDRYIIRSALPYGNDLDAALKIDPAYFLVSAGILLIFVIVFYNVMKHLGQNINRLNDFANQAEHENIVNYPVRFSNDEVGDIARHIVEICNRFQEAKRALVVEQERVLEQKEVQARIKRQLTQNIAHELKTPVSSIQGYLETIINVKDLPKDILESFIEKCYTQSTRLSSLLHEISILNRMDEVPEMIMKEKVDLAKLIAVLLYDVSMPLQDKKITVYNRTEGMSLVCIGNHSLLYSVFRNLIDNTLAYAGEWANVYIECNTENPEYFYFSYSDNGCGVSEEYLDRIFERFYRIDKGRSRKAGGTGLGLSVVKNAVLLHGGTIKAKQRAGGGLEFVFSIKREP